MQCVYCSDIKLEMKDNTPAVFVLNARKFDIIFGFSLMFGSAFMISGDQMQKYPLLVGVFGVIIYFAEAWAFYFKTVSIRIRALKKINIDKDWSTNGSLPALPRVMIFGRVLRSILRVVILSLALRSILNAYDDLTEHQENVVQGLWFVGIIFEGVMMRMTRLSNRPKEGKEKSDDHNKEMEWRRKRLGFLESKLHLYKEACADFVLVITAMMFTQTYWKFISNFYIDRIGSALRADIPMGNLLWTMFVTMTLTSIILVIPARLAFWVEDAYAAVDGKRRRKVRWSVVFGCVSVMFPVLLHFVRAAFFS